MSVQYDDFVERIQAKEDSEREYRKFRAQDTRSLNDTVHDGVRMARNIADGLDRLATAFAITGNTKVADDLSHMAGVVVNTLDEIRSAHSRELSHQLDKSQRMMFQTFAAAVAVSTREHDAAVRIAYLEEQVEGN